MPVAFYSLYAEGIATDWADVRSAEWVMRQPEYDPPVALLDRRFRILWVRPGIKRKTLYPLLREVIKTKAIAERMGLYEPNHC